MARENAPATFSVAFPHAHAIAFVASLLLTAMHPATARVNESVSVVQFVPAEAAMIIGRYEVEDESLDPVAVEVEAAAEETAWRLMKWSFLPAGP